MGKIRVVLLSRKITRGSLVFCIQTVSFIVMENIAEQALATYTRTVPLWLRYVDDTFTAVHKDGIDDFHEHLNRQNVDIQFTKEIEENGKIPFLDCFHVRRGSVFGLCIKVGRGQGNGYIGTRVWRLGTWGRETRDLGTSSMGHGYAGTSKTGTQGTRDVNNYRKSRR